MIADILTAWRAPRVLMREKLAHGPREDRALAVIMGAGMLAFLAQWPALARAAQVHTDVPLDARLGGALLGGLFFLPLFAYALAAILHLIAKIFGGKGTFYSARLALFWAFLSVTPLMLAQGILAGFLGQSWILTSVGLGVALWFLWVFGQMFHEAQR